MSYFSRLTYNQAIAQGLYSNIYKWSKIGYCPITATTETDIWSYGGSGGVATIPLIATAATLKVQTNNAADKGTSIFSGTSDGGSTTSLVDSTKDFTGGTAVAAGDCVLLDAGGTTPEWGFVTAIPNATTLTIAGGFSGGGTGSSRTYSVIDYSNQAGAHAVLVNGLDANFATIREIVVCGGAGPTYVETTKSFLRVNSFRVIAAGANSKPTAAIALMDNAAGPTITYSYITAGYTRARNSIYTVAAGSTLWVSEWNAGFAAQTTGKQETCRIYTRASQYSFESTAAPFLSRVSNGVDIFYPYTEVVMSNTTVSIQFPEPTKILQKVDLKVSAYASAAGIVASTLRGYVTTP